MSLWTMRITSDEWLWRSPCRPRTSVFKVVEDFNPAARRGEILSPCQLY